MVWTVAKAFFLSWLGREWESRVNRAGGTGCAKEEKREEKAKFRNTRCA